MALQRVHQQLAEVTAQRDAAEDRFVKQRQECVEQEDEIARLTCEIDIRKENYARLQEEYDAAKPYIRTQECDEGFNDDRYGDGLMRRPGAGFVSGALFMVVMWVVFK